MTKQAIYKGKARYYDLIYSWKDYRKESEKIKQLVRRFKKSKGKDLLEVACGTGKHAKYLKDHFSILATDLNKNMLAIARRNVKGVSFREANMLNLNLRQQFDVVLCLFSSVGHAKTSTNLKKAISNFAQHLKRGGVLVIEPWVTGSAYKEGIPHLTVYKSPTIDIARLHVSKRSGNISVMDMHYLVGERKGVTHFIDRQELGLFEIKDTLKFMRDAGLVSKYLKESLFTRRWKGRGLYIGVKK